MIRRLFLACILPLAGCAVTSVEQPNGHYEVTQTRVGPVTGALMQDAGATPQQPQRPVLGGTPPPPPAAFFKATPPPGDVLISNEPKP